MQSAREDSDRNLEFEANLTRRPTTASRDVCSDSEDRHEHEGHSAAGAGGAGSGKSAAAGAGGGFSGFDSPKHKLIRKAGSSQTLSNTTGAGASSTAEKFASDRPLTSCKKKSDSSEKLSLFNKRTTKSNQGKIDNKSGFVNSELQKASHCFLNQISSTVYG